MLVVAATERELDFVDGFETLCCGIGPVEAALATARRLADHTPTAVLHIGIAGAKTIAVDPKTHNVYLFQPERGPAPAPPPGAEPPAKGGRGRGPQGPIVAAWFIVIKE